MTDRLAFALDAARAAGEITLRYFQKGVAVERKSNETPVTVADREAERFLRDAIGRTYPGENILGEEEGGESRPDQWVLDPIDGTKSFVCGVPLYAVLLSYEQKGVPVLGVCHFPALNETLHAKRGGGAFWNGKPCRVSARVGWQRATVCCAGHRGMSSAGLSSKLLELAAQVQATRTWCDAYGHALVATGRVEAMIDPSVARWDISGLQVIVEEAGGVFTSLEGEPNPSSSALSAPPQFHAELLEALRR